LLETPLSADQTYQDLGEHYLIQASVPETELLHRWLLSQGDAIDQVSLKQGVK